MSPKTNYCLLLLQNMSDNFLKFNSRRSTVYSTRGIVASSQPLASAAGIKILSLGGNALEASIAVSAALCVVEPTSTGIGGDCFVLFQLKESKKVEGINGCGRAAAKLTIRDVFDLENNGNSLKRIPNQSVLSITVPGAIAAWQDSFEKWGSGKVSFEQILQPAIDLANDGFGVHEIASDLWNKCEKKLISQNPKVDPLQNPLLLNGKAPKEGDFIDNKPLADALRLIAKNGKKAFYEGPIADAIIKTTDAKHHKLTKEDLIKHESTFVDPISIEFGDYKVWEIPPNGQGLVVLIALGIIRELNNLGKINLSTLKHNSSEYLHLLIETLKIAFKDADEIIGDPKFDDVPVKEILSSDNLQRRAKLFNPDKALDLATVESPLPGHHHRSNTVYISVTDSEGNACSFINSVYYGFGSGILVDDFGFCLTNRGANFNLTSGLNNCLEGGKRPYHTIIPGFITNLENDFFASYGNMGGFIQPVGHVIHFLNLTLFQLNPQQSIDSPRFSLRPSELGIDTGRGGGGPASTEVTVVQLEDGIPEDVIQDLQKLGHSTEVISGYERSTFGRAQIIKNESKSGKLLHSGGSDLRGDGAAVPFL